MNKNEPIRANLELMRGVILALMTALFSLFGYLGVLLYRADLIIWFIIVVVAGIVALLYFLYAAFCHYADLVHDLEDKNG